MHYTLIWEEIGKLFTFIVSTNYASYEAYVLYMFFRLLSELANGEEAMVAQLEQKRQMRY
jgi:hypothetical protein